MKNDASLPKLWNFYKTLSVFLISGGIILCFIRLHKFDSDAVKTYHKVKESRRGTIRKAKEKKENVPFSQEREGITRNIWIEDESGLRRQFFLSAVSAVAKTDDITKKSSVKEQYDKPKGFYQEEFFWENTDTGEKILFRDGNYVKATPPYRKVKERFLSKIVPMQRVRFFDATSGEWDPVENIFTAYGAFFHIVKIHGHEVPQSDQEGEVIAKGSSASISFSTENGTMKQIHSQGMKLHFIQGNNK